MPKVLNTPMYDEYRMAQNALHEAKAINAAPIITNALELYLAGLKLEKELQEARKGEQSETFWTTTDALLGCHRS